METTCGASFSPRRLPPGPPFHGDVHGHDLHARHGNGQHPGAASSLAKNPIKNFFIEIISAMIFIKTMTGKGNGGGMGGGSDVNFYHAIH
jgi:hypothetical protein